jgi:peptidoglycan/LPS O-acetylase OafA/YrhL
MSEGQRQPVRRLAEIDGLRGIAALSVLLYHAWLYTRTPVTATTRAGALDPVLHELRLGLVLFFVLSGFLLYGPWVTAALEGRPRPRLGAYLLRRAARVAPAYYLALAGAVALLWGVGDAPGVRLPSAGQLPLFALFSQNYSDGSLMKLDPPMWTLAVEVSFYLALPAIGALALTMRGGRARQALAPALLLALGVGWNVWLAGRAHVAGPLAKTLPAMLPYFAAGMLAAVLAHGRRPGRRLTAWLLAGGAALVVGCPTSRMLAEGAAGWGFWLRALRDLPAAVGFAAIIAACATGSGRAARLPAARPLAAFGTISYGAYLWHVPLIAFLRAHGLLPLHTAAALAVALPLTIAVAALSWFAVERPALRWAHTRELRLGRVAPGAAALPLPPVRLRVAPGREDAAALAPRAVDLAPLAAQVGDHPAGPAAGRAGNGLGRARLLLGRHGARG